MISEVVCQKVPKIVGSHCIIWVQLDCFVEFYKSTIMISKVVCQKKPKIVVSHCTHWIEFDYFLVFRKSSCIISEMLRQKVAKSHASHSIIWVARNCFRHNTASFIELSLGNKSLVFLQVCRLTF